jgi:ADP-ribose pyrophosphatase YjhB (NUDIX family)
MTLAASKKFHTSPFLLPFLSCLSGEEGGWGRVKHPQTDYNTDYPFEPERPAMPHMITFDEDQIRFTNRVVGIAYDRGRVLLHRAVTDDFWALPGGRAELLEIAAEALRREMREELNETVEVERLVWIAENFFELVGRAHHEIGFYFLMHLPPDSPLRQHTAPFDGQEGDLRLIFEWFPVETLEQVYLFPTFLRTGLKDLPSTTTHIVHTDSKEDG